MMISCVFSSLISTPGSLCTKFKMTGIKRAVVAIIYFNGLERKYLKIINVKALDLVANCVYEVVKNQ